MNGKSRNFIGAAFLAALLLAACGNDETASQPAEQKEEHAANGHGMNHGGGEVPEGLKEAADPAYPVGSVGVIQHGHMDGMEGAEATISGAYETIVYAVSYTPENGDDPVENHKWVIHEEIQDAGEEPFAAGDEVILAADHIAGMKGASAKIDSAEETTVYMVDFTSTTGEKLTNHQWITENELTAE